MKRIAIYGKGGIGKSTTACAVAACMAADGLTVLQIGCDPKADSTLAHTLGRPIPTVLSLLRETNGAAGLHDMAVLGGDGVWCVECGGPVPGTGCAGRGIVAAFEALRERGAYERIRPDVVLYDVLGDVVCGGFAMPLRGEYARDVFVVTSGEKMSLYAAANILQAIEGFRARDYARLSGLILNRRGVPEEELLVRELAAEAGTEIVADLPREPLVAQAEAAGAALPVAFPASPAAGRYRDLARRMLSLSREVGP